MKTLYTMGLAVLVLVGAAACSGSAQVQDSENTNFTNVIDSRNYIFVARSVTPLGGRYRQLTSDYDLSVLGDSVVAFLPYFGRAYTVPLDPTKGGIQFTSTNFGYQQTPTRRGGWSITIEPKDAQDVRQLTLNVTSSGNATLQVISNNRQSISFEGYIEPRK